MHEPARSRHLSILYVEDDEMVRRAIILILKKRYPRSAIRCAGNGKEGLEFFTTTDPDIVITDITMPVMDGLQMARKIRAIDPGARIIVTSANMDKEKIVDIIGIDGNCFVQKPIIPGELFAAIDGHIDRMTAAPETRPYQLTATE